jgi:hypothetical protein
VIPIDGEHRRSEATLVSVIVVEVFTIVNENDDHGDSTRIISGGFGGVRGGSDIVNF